MQQQQQQQIHSNNNNAMYGQHRGGGNMGPSAGGAAVVNTNNNGRNQMISPPSAAAAVNSQMMMANSDMNSAGGTSSSWMGGQSNAATGASSVDGNNTLPSSHASLPHHSGGSSSGYGGGGGMHHPSHNLKATMGSNNNNNNSNNRVVAGGATGILPGYDDGGTAVPPRTTSRVLFCLECYDPKKEWLEYDYTRDKGPDGQPQPYPRIRERGEYYIDSYNDQPWSWTFGTHEKNGTWFNSSDQAGSIMSVMVWVLLIYSQVTITLLTLTQGIPVYLGMIYSVLVTLALAAHAKTSLTDPGSVPVTAIPSERQRMTKDAHSMCGQCQTFKPPGSHHCRICNRCISRMDHHCPWMNNCVGAANLKHFCLFLVYTWTTAAFALSVFGWNYFFCATEDCTFHPVVIHLVRLMTILAIGAFLFTSSMLMNVCYGVMTGIGTIDRLKKKATNTMNQSDEEPIALIDIFGIAPWYTWPFPVDPIFEDHDRVMGYTMPQRLDRERQFCEAKRPPNSKHPNEHLKQNGSMELPTCLNELLPA